MANWLHVESLYIVTLEKAWLNEFASNMLRLVKYLRENMDEQIYDVGTSMYHLVVWRIQNKSDKLDIAWEKGKGYLISKNSFETQVQHITLEEVLSNIKALL